jgi:hypothetical protein
MHFNSIIISDFLNLNLISYFRLNITTAYKIGPEKIKMTSN